MFIVEVENEKGKWEQDVPVLFRDLHDAADVAHRLARKGKRARVVIVENADGSMS